MSSFLNMHRSGSDCPSCGRKVRTTIGATRRSPKLHCPNGREIEVDASQFDRELTLTARSPNSKGA